MRMVPHRTLTSRVRLRVAAELEYPLEPFAEDEAIEFFVERARAVKRDVRRDPSVAEICRRLDGLPLALELAASRVKVLDPSLLLERLESGYFDRQRVTSRSSPMFLVTASMTNLLLAEALERGFAGITGTSAGYFDAGIKASMDQMASYGAGSAVSAAARDTYAAARAVAFREVLQKSARFVIRRAPQRHRRRSSCRIDSR